MTSPVLLDAGPNNWSFVLRRGWMFGASYTFRAAGRDLEDYGATGKRHCIRIKPSGLDSQSWYNDSFRDNCKGCNIVRGRRVQAPAGAGAAGRLRVQRFDVSKGRRVAPLRRCSRRPHLLRARRGVHVGRGVLLDIAYQYVFVKTPDYYLFYVWDEEGSADSAVYSTEVKRHNVALTLGIPFLKAYIFNIKVRLCCGPLFFGGLQSGIKVKIRKIWQRN